MDDRQAYEILDTTARGAMQFVESFYEAFDTKRLSALAFYSDSAVLVWNGHGIRGKEQITAAFNELPSTKHNIISCDCQPMLEAQVDRLVLVMVTGQVTYGIDKESHVFCQNFVLVGKEAAGRLVFYINNDEFRFV